jgi:DNA repair protein recO
MKQLQKKKGIVLTSKDYKENARLLTILTSDGLEHTILRGANKINSKNKAFSIAPVGIDYVISSAKPLSTLTEASIIHNYTHIKLDSMKNLIVFAMIEKVLIFTENIDDKAMFFNFFYTILDKLDNTQYPYIVLNLFEIKLMYLLGIAPVLNHCMICMKPHDHYVLSLKHAGTICKTCSPYVEYELNESATKVYQYLYFIKLDKADEHFFNLIYQTNIDLDDWINQYYEKYIDFYSKAKKVIRKVL